MVAEVSKVFQDSQSKQLNEPRQIDKQTRNFFSLSRGNELLDRKTAHKRGRSATELYIFFEGATYLQDAKRRLDTKKEAFQTTARSEFNPPEEKTNCRELRWANESKKSQKFKRSILESYNYIAFFERKENKRLRQSKGATITISKTTLERKALGIRDNYL